MVDERTQEEIPDWQRQAWLTEYQACQEDNSANFQGFWTLAAIFIGLSSVFLAGLIYAVIANKSLFSILLDADHNETGKTLVIGIIALIIGIANVVILKKIKGWHRRIMFNQRVNLRRMREIELDLGMHRCWRIPAINTWYDMLKSDKRNQTKCNDLKWDKLKKKLGEGLDEKRLKKLDERKDEILGLLKQYFTAGKVKDRYGKYEPPSSRKHFPCILYTLMSLWVLVISAALFVSISVWNMLVGIVVAIVVLIAYAAVVVCRLKRSKLETI